MFDLLIRFVIGGVVVSLFAVIGDMLKPKTFAGLFGAAPSVALATLGLTGYSKGNLYASIEARSMMIGGVGFILYSLAVAVIMTRFKTSARRTTLCLLPGWVLLAIGFWHVLLG